LFAGDSSGKYWRMFEDTFYVLGSATARGGDITADLISDSAGVPIPTRLKTKLYELGNPMIKKKMGSLAAIIEQGDFTFSYLLDLGQGKVTEPLSLGVYKSGINEKKLPKNEGYRIGFEITSNTLANLPTLNAIIIRNVEAAEKIEYAAE